MSIDPFPESVSPRKLCNRNGSINSSIPLGKLLRLSEYLHDNHGRAEVCLSFYKDEAGHCVISGTVTAKVIMQCQRCLEATPVKLSSELEVMVADSDEDAEAMAGSLNDPLDRLEIVVCEDGKLDLMSVVEDELIMSLPIVVSHPDEHCSERLNALRKQSRNLDEDNQGFIKGLEELEKLKQALKKDRKDRENDK